MIVPETFRCGATPQRLKACQKRLPRNEPARFYHWKQLEAIGPIEFL